MYNERIGKLGFSIRTNIFRIDKEIYSKLSLYSTPNLSDAMNRFKTMDYRIKPISKHCKFIGPAITVRVRPGNNLMIHKAIDIAKAGDIIVIDTSDCSTNAVWGELMTKAAIKKGISGVVIKGAIRDVEENKKIRLPIFSRYIVSSACDKGGHGEINEPISCGGIVVCLGDIIVGDENGVVAIPPDLIEEVIANAEIKINYEKKRIKDIDDGLIASLEIDEIFVKKNILMKA